MCVDWPPLQVRRFAAPQDYRATLEAMRAFADARTPATPDALWLLEHPPVFTLGQAGRLVHLRDPGAVPVIRSDRGGQLTYHGPGQLVAYLLFDLRRAGLGVRTLVERLEQSVIDLLATLGIAGQRRPGAPGVYVGAAKLAALGLRVRRGGCYHGLALNVDLDLEPFGRIDPCGYPGLAVTRLSDLAAGVSMHWAADALTAALAHRLERRAVPWSTVPPPGIAAPRSTALCLPARAGQGGT